MKVSDVVANSGQHVWAEVGLVVFLLLFAAVLVYTFARRNRKTFERARSLPLEDDAPAQEKPADEHR